MENKGLSAGREVENRHFYEDDPDDRFYDDREKAATRLRALVDEACKILPTQTLGLASFHLCTYLDVSENCRKQHQGIASENARSRSERMGQELDASRRSRHRNRFGIIRGGKCEGGHRQGP